MYGLVRLILSPETTGPIEKIKALIDFWSVQDRNMGLYGLARGSVWQQNSLLAVLFH